MNDHPHDSMSRIAVITNVLAHYRVPCFKSLSLVLRDRVGFFMLARDMLHRRYVLTENRPDFDVQWLRGWRQHIPPFDDRHLNDIRPIVRGTYDIIIMGGWDEPTYLLTWLWGVLTKKKVLFWIESTAHEGKRRGIKEACKRMLLKYAAGCIVPGRRSRDYCAALGMPVERIFIAPNAADRTYFSNQAAKLLTRRRELREGLGLKGVTFLFAGRLVEIYKNVSCLIDAFGRLERQGMDVDLVIVGDGTDRTLYEAMVREGGFERVRFLGEVDHAKICEIYAAADIFVLPSSWETWGFVLNESMEFGLPLIASNAVGAGPDLVRQGENGFIFPTGDVDELTRNMTMLAQDETLRKRMGEASRCIIEHFSPENWAKGVLRAIDTVSADKRK